MLAGFSRRVLDTRHLDLVSMLHGSGKIVGRLEPIPGFRAAAESLVETDRHLGRDAGMAVDDVGDLLAADAEALRRPGKASRLYISQHAPKPIL